MASTHSFRSGAPAPALSTGDASQSHRRPYRRSASARYGAAARRQKSAASACGAVISRSHRPQDHVRAASAHAIVRAHASITARAQPEEASRGDANDAPGGGGNDGTGTGDGSRPVAPPEERAGWSRASRDARAGQTVSSSARATRVAARETSSVTSASAANETRAPSTHTRAAVAARATTASASLRSRARNG